MVFGGPTTRATRPGDELARQIRKAGDLAKMVNTDIRAQALERAGK